MASGSKRPVDPDEIAERASRGEDVSEYFTNEFVVEGPARRDSVDSAPEMARELDERAERGTG